MTAPTLRALSVGELLDVSLNLYRSLFAPLLVIAAVCQVVPQLISIYVVVQGGLVMNLRLGLVGSLLSLVLGAIGIAATTFVVSDAYLGEQTTAGRALARAMPYAGRIVAISMLSGLLAFFGFILLIVPGVIIFTGLWLATSVAVLESPPSATAAMRRSWQLTSGHRAKVAVLLFVSLCALLVPAIIFGSFTQQQLLGGGDLGVTTLLLLALQTVLSIAIYPFLYVLATVAYYDLRVRKEGFDLELLAAALGDG